MNVSCLLPNLPQAYLEAPGAFSGINPEHPEYSWRAEVTFRPDGLRLDGGIYHRRVHIGEFVRYLDIEGAVKRARHVTFQIAPQHQRKHIAFYHYQKALRYYDKHGFQTIELYARHQGILAWPQIGFDFVNECDKEQMFAILSKRGILAELTNHRDIFLPDIATTRANGLPIGFELLREFYSDNRKGVHLRLDLTNARQRAFLLKTQLLMR